MASFRYWFRSSTGRDAIKIGEKYFIKLYSDVAEAYYEYRVLSEIANFSPNLFRVPKVFKLIALSDMRGAIVMEYIPGKSLDTNILAFLFTRDLNVVGIFNRIGKALRELHRLPLTGLKGSEFPSSNKIFIRDLKMLINNGMKIGLFNPEDYHFIIRAIENLEIVKEFFATTNLHGEMYFTHILLQKDGSIVFVDFHNMRKGPLYYDLAMFAISLYSSILFMPWSPKKFTPLIRAFLTGYLGKRLSNRYIRSFAAVQLYVILRELQKHLETPSSRESIIKVVIPSKIKIKRLRKALKEAVIPQLV